MATDLSAHPTLEKVRDMFVVSANTGLRYSDIANIKPENVKEGRYLDIVTIKTKQRLLIPLAEPVKQIINKYSGKLPKIPVSFISMIA